jgi:acyl carrier protein
MPNKTEIYATLTEIFRDVFMLDDLALRPEFTAKDIEGWDSFKQIEIIVAAEQRFGVRMTSRELDGLQNVGDLAQVIASKLVA